MPTADRTAVVAERAEKNISSFPLGVLDDLGGETAFLLSSGYP